MNKSGPDDLCLFASLDDAVADRYRLLVEAVADYGILMLDPRGIVVSWNPGDGNGDGFVAGEVVGKPYSCLFTPDDVAGGAPAVALDAALRTGRFDGEGLRQRKDGSTYWAAVTITSIRDAEGRHLGFAHMTRDASERRRIQEGERLLERAIESFSQQGVSITDSSQPDNPIVYVNDGFVRLTGYSREDVIGRNCRFLQGAETAPESVEEIRSAIRTGQPCLVELVNYRKDGTPFWNALALSPLRDGDGVVTHFAGVQTHVSSFKLLEQRFRQAQKMDAIGRLAGGVAHDFNNLLTVISGYSEILLESAPPDDPNREALQQIAEAGERAAGLTGQLLFFSRQAVLQTKVIDLNAVVQDTQKLLQRMIGEDVTLRMILAPDLHRVRIDPGQMGQILMNLAINARDAMPQGGHLTIETANAWESAAEGADSPGAALAREFVTLAVGDDGSGMTPEIRRRIFEPFFTTKAPGKGTGLGLATVYGIVEESGGRIDLETEPGHGTTFRIFLPSVLASADLAQDGASGPAATRGIETVLLVEDEEAVRTMGVLALRRAGYTVLHADRGERALALAERHPGRIDILVTDVVMPGMSGRELADSLRLRFPSVQVLYASGYTDDAVIRHGVQRSEVAFLQKPYTPHSLTRKLREVLDRQQAGQGLGSVVIR